jgi:hypothetical protein
VHRQGAHPHPGPGPQQRNGFSQLLPCGRLTAQHMALPRMLKDQKGLSCSSTAPAMSRKSCAPPRSAAKAPWGCWHSPCPARTAWAGIPAATGPA